MTKSQSAFLVLIYMVAYALTSAFPQSQPSPAQRPAFANQAPGPANAPGRFGLEPGRPGETVSVRDGRLTLRMVNREIDSVVGVITSTTHIPVVDVEGALDRHRVNFDFRSAPLDEALKLILKDYDTFFLYAGDGDATAKLRQVWIYAKGQGRSFDPIPHEACTSGKELREMVRGRDPNLKTRAFQALIEREGDKVRDVAVQWLNSAEEEERNLALFYSLDNSLELPTETLMSLAVADNSPAIRAMALDALAGADPNLAQGVLRQALNDPDEQVRSRAQEILARLNSSAGLPTMDQTK